MVEQLLKILACLLATREAVGVTVLVEYVLNKHGQHPKCGRFITIQRDKKQANNEIHALAIANIGVAHGVGHENASKSSLALRGGEPSMGREGAANVDFDLVASRVGQGSLGHGAQVREERGRLVGLFICCTRSGHPNARSESRRNAFADELFESEESEARGGPTEEEGSHSQVGFGQVGFGCDVLG